MEIMEITKEEAFKITGTHAPKGLFWLEDDGKFIAIDNSTEAALVEEFNDKEECLQWLKDWFKKPGSEELYGNRKVCYNQLANSVRESYANLRDISEVEKVSDLITNMALAGASTEEMEQVIDYSINVLDAFKCELRCKESRINNGIEKLEEKYMKEV